jgi:RNA polymerase sigma factor (sigma-70 family)
VVQGVLRRVLGSNDSEYEDILQTALQRVVETFREASARGCAMSQWAAVITRNVAVDALRVRCRERRYLLRDDGAAIAGCSSGIDPEQVVCARESLGEFASALTRLRAGYAEVVYMHDVLGYELGEIGAMLGLTVAAAQSRLVRGRRRMAPRESRSPVVSPASPAAVDGLSPRVPVARRQDLRALGTP